MSPGICAFALSYHPLCGGLVPAEDLKDTVSEEDPAPSDTVLSSSSPDLRI